VGRGHETDHLWSLSIEEQFYVLWPLVLICLPRRNRTRLFFALAGLIGATLWRVYAARTGLASVGALYIRSDFRFDAPLFGCALALALRVAPSTTRWPISTGRRSAALAIIGVFSLTAWVGMKLGEAVYPGTDATVVCLLGAVLVLSQIGVQSRGSRWLAWMPLVVIGQVSYGIYLWQQLFLGHLHPGFDRIRAFPVGLVATLAVTGVSYLFLERPLLRLKDRKWHKVVQKS
jgi:peptidoglycan/LPS O-acetylase OafA/YrhL